MKHALSVFCGLLWACLPAYAQNLVPNPDFEFYQELPNTTSEIDKLRAWFNPAGENERKRATPDFFHEDGGADAKLPNIAWASGMTIKPQSGKGIAGIIATNHLNTREYLCVQLKTPLQKNQTYRISFYYAQGEGRQLGALATSLGVGFSQKRPWQRLADALNPTVKIQPTEILQSKEWAKFECEYKATHDNLAYFIIGNFLTESTDAKKVYDKSIFGQWAYYFIDSVSVAMVASPPPIEEIKITKEEENILERASYVQFKTGEALILPESYHILDDVVDFLNRYPTGKLSLEGHTDNVGTPERNLMLSQARAEAIKVYFITKGIKAERLTAKGFGLTVPKDSNETVEGRAKNRRVEMKFKASW
ncbi:MAG: OmpA family protein [Bacteroidetes bacterium]|nr:MAG: OmpA family protein [Bacteroidota bacterium]